MHGDLMLPDYVYPRRWETPRSSKAWRWTGVGVVMTVKAGRPPAGRMATEGRGCWRRSASRPVPACLVPRQGRTDSAADGEVPVHSADCEMHAPLNENETS